MKIAEFGTLQLARSDAAHFGKAKLSSVKNPASMPSVTSIKGVSKDTELYSLSGVDRKSVV